VAEKMLSEFNYSWPEAEFSPDDSMFLVRGLTSWVEDQSPLETMYAIEKQTERTVASFVADQGEGIRDFDWSPDGSKVVGATWLGTIYIWDFETGELLHKMVHGDGAFVNEVEWSPDGTRIATAGIDSIAWIWDAATGEPLYSLVGHEPPAEVWSVTWSPDGTRLLTTSGNEDIGAEDKTARVWDANTGEELLTIPEHSSTVIWGSWSPDGTRILTTSTDNTTRVWDAETGEELLTLATPNQYYIVAEWSPNGDYFAVVGMYTAMQVWRVWQTKEELIDYARECCVFRELTAEEREQFGLPPR
jgi:WD40 repeat protein